MASGWEEGGRAGDPNLPLTHTCTALQTLDEAFELAKALAKNNPGWVYVPPFDDPLIWYVGPTQGCAGRQTPERWHGPPWEI